MTRQTIAIDVDDVLSASAEGFSDFSNRRWGLATTPAEYTEAWAEFWKVPIEVAVARAEEFHTTDAVYHYKHFDGAVPVLKHLKERFNLIVVTSRRSVLKAHTDRWLEEHFPGIFDDIHYAGIWDPANTNHLEHKLKQTKAELCRELGADYLIDDQAKHCAGAQEAGVQALLFGNYNWNRDEKLPEGVVRVKDWEAVKEYFDAAR